ncbi:MAG: glycosyltransferase [Selenomonadaceae bacterium]|nr:glycosyltransferase [Selenomonadaceae bacterium]
MREAIDSALSQTYPNIEVIVVNDGSNDDGGTREIALSYGDKIRYFEKDNGGVSTALNLGIQNMKGKYFSWLSHDDVYLPEKVQTEIDALRASGDMSRIVYSNWSSLLMPERKITEWTETLQYRQEFLETGTFASLFAFISGCSLLIPKIYFDAYGGFDENYRAVQDYKKWFEMFRGKRLIYIRKSLILSRVHIEQTTRTYDRIMEEEKWLHYYLFSNLESDDLVGSGLTDLYHLYSAVFSRWLHFPYPDALSFVFQKLNELPESPDTNERIKKFRKFLLDKKYKTYFLSESEQPLRIAFALRGMENDLNFIPSEQAVNIIRKNNVRIFDFISLRQWLIDTPIKKDLLNKVIKVGQ